MKTYTIHLLRHGFTEGNYEGKYIGRTDLPLCEEGKKQLYALAQSCTYPKADAYFTSPLLRCTQTLEILYPGAIPICIPGFRECNFGKFEERTADELSDDPDFIRWMNEGGQFAPPEGESTLEFMQRTLVDFDKVVEGMMKTGTTTAVIIAHSGTIMSILSAYGLPKASFYDWATAPGKGYTIRIQPRLWTSDKVFEVCNVLPFTDEQEPDNESYLVDIGREAAMRAYSKKDSENSEE